MAEHTASRTLLWLARTRRLSWPILEQFAWPASQLVLAPLLLKRLGSEHYGLWVLALTVLIAAPALSLGRSTALLVLVPQYEVRSESIGWLLRRALRPIGLTGVLSVLIGASAAWAWTGVHSSALSPVHLALYALEAALLLVVTEIDNAFACTLKGLSQFRTAALAEVAGRALQVIACIGLVSPGDSVHWVLTLSLVSTVIKAGLKVAAVHASHHATAEASRTLPAAGDTALHELRSLGAWNCMQVASGLIFFGYDRWVVGYLSGVATLASYGICSQYVQFSHSIASAACQPLIPWAARHCDARGVTRDAARVRRTVLMAAIVCCIPVSLCWLLARPALSWWISPAFAADNAALTDRMCIVFALLALNVPFINVLIGLRRSRFVAFLALGSGIALILSSAIWPPVNMFDMIDLKIVYAVMTLTSVAALLRLLRKARTLQTDTPR